ncbi:MAG: hypothetical protein WCI41_03775 [bacterium]
MKYFKISRFQDFKISRFLILFIVIFFLKTNLVEASYLSKYFGGKIISTPASAVRILTNAGFICDGNIRHTFDIKPAKNSIPTGPYFMDQFTNSFAYFNYERKLLAINFTVGKQILGTYEIKPEQYVCMNEVGATETINVYKVIIFGMSKK